MNHSQKIHYQVSDALLFNLTLLDLSFSIHFHCTPLSSLHPFSIIFSFLNDKYVRLNQTPFGIITSKKCIAQ